MANGMTPRSQPDVVVVGAGIVGAACAYWLAREGLHVLICDAEFPGSGATAAGMGHIVVMDDSPAQLALTARSRTLWEELVPSLSPACEDRMPGTLWIAAGVDEMAHLPAKQALYANAGVRAEVLDEHALASAEPNLRRGLAGALFVPGDRVLYPPNAARWFVEQAIARGAELRSGTRVTAVAPGSVSISSNGTPETIGTGSVVLANGIDAPALVPRLAVVPRRGHLVITERYPGLIRSQLVELGYLHSAHSMTGASTAFNLQPRATGQILIGSSRELVGRDTRINRRIAQEMMARAVEFVPALAACETIRTWTGFRPATPDQLPFVGVWPEIRGLHIAVGHEGLGITTATGTAELIAAAILGRRPPIDPAPYSPTRRMPVAEVA
jgi:glycine/D-amino acid oxidase-like deaminating enzyme